MVVGRSSSGARSLTCRGHCSLLLRSTLHSFCSGRRKSTCPASVSASWPPIRICTSCRSGRLVEHRVDDGVDGHQLLHRCRRDALCESRVEIDEHLVAIRHEDAAQRRAFRESSRPAAPAPRPTVAPRRIERACATAPSASGTSARVGTRRRPSSEAKNSVALICGTAGASAGGAGAAPPDRPRPARRGPAAAARLSAGHQRHARTTTDGDRRCSDDRQPIAVAATTESLIFTRARSVQGTRGT